MSLHQVKQHVARRRCGRTRSSQTITVKPAPAIVIEGLFALYDAELCKLMSLKVFVDTAADVRFIRRLQRDISERGRSTDVIFPHGATAPAVDIITTKVASLIRDLNPA